MVQSIPLQKSAIHQCTTVILLFQLQLLSIEDITKNKVWRQIITPEKSSKKTMSLKSPLTLATPTDISSFPRELHLNILTFLRATDLSSLQRTCRCFNNRELIVAVVDHYSHEVVSFFVCY